MEKGSILKVATIIMVGARIHVQSVMDKKDANINRMLHKRPLQLNCSGLSYLQASK